VDLVADDTVLRSRLLSALAFTEFVSAPRPRCSSMLRILRKLEVTSRTEAAAVAHHNGLGPDARPFGCFS
jgi:hypothetical protein